MTLGYRTMTPSKFQEALVKTLEISALILFLVAASNFFGAVFSQARARRRCSPTFAASRSTCPPMLKSCSSSWR